MLAKFQDTRNVSGPQLAAVLGLKRDRIVRLKKRGVIQPQNPVGRPCYSLLESVARYIEFHRNSANNRLDAGNDDLTQSKLRKILSRVGKAKQKLAKLESQVSLATNVEEVHGKMNTIIADCLRGFPLETAKDLVGVKDMPTASETLERHSYALLNRIQRE
jgi:plasmid maintenance system antidote protein VapI